MDRTKLFEEKLSLKWTELKNCVDGADGTNSSDFLELPVLNNLSTYIFYDSLENASNLDESSASHDLQRIEAKCDLILHILSQLLESQKKILLRYQVTFYADSIYIPFQKDEISQITEGSLLSIQLFLKNDVSIPVEYIMRVEEIDKNGCYMTFTSIGSDERQAWDKWLFKKHRRYVATNKQQ